MKGPSHFGEKLEGPAIPRLRWSAILNTSYYFGNILSLIVPFSHPLPVSTAMLLGFFPLVIQPFQILAPFYRKDFLFLFHLSCLHNPQRWYHYFCWTHHFYCIHYGEGRESCGRFGRAFVSLKCVRQLRCPTFTVLLSHLADDLNEGFVCCFRLPISLRVRRR